MGHRRAHLLVCWGCFVLQQQSWTFETETMLPTKPKIYLSLALYGKSLLTPTLEIRSFLFILTWNRRCVLFHRLYCVLKCCCFILCAHASVCVCVYVCVCMSESKQIYTHSFILFCLLTSALTIRKSEQHPLQNQLYLLSLYTKNGVL